MRYARPLAAAVVLLAAAIPRPAAAHHIWLEAGDDGLKLYFGEFNENLREASPGLLDRLQPQAAAVAASGRRPLTVEKSPGAFLLRGSLAAGESVIAEDVRSPVATRKTGDVTTRSVNRPAARFLPDRAVREPTLDLDIVPSGEPDLYRVVFKGQPLAKTKITVSAVSGWTLERQTSEAGLFTAALPWRGTYVMEVRHADRTPGKQGEDTYDVMNFVTSLTLVQSSGLDPLPAPPPKPPNK